MRRSSPKPKQAGDCPHSITPKMPSPNLHPCAVLSKCSRSYTIQRLKAFPILSTCAFVCLFVSTHDRPPGLGREVILTFVCNKFGFSHPSWSKLDAVGSYIQSLGVSSFEGAPFVLRSSFMRVRFCSPDHASLLVNSLFLVAFGRLVCA